jgi:hypothetical protein
MAQCQGCKGDLTNENSVPSVVKRGRGMCNLCARLYIKNRRYNNRKSFILYGSRHNSKTRGIKNKLLLSDIPDAPTYCPVFPWIELLFAEDGKRSDSTPSLDRIDNTVGYVKRNIRIVSWRANRLKQDATDKELIALGKDATKRIKTKELPKIQYFVSEEIAESIGC